MIVGPNSRGKKDCHAAWQALIPSARAQVWHFQSLTLPFKPSFSGVDRTPLRNLIILRFYINFFESGKLFEYNNSIWSEISGTGRENLCRFYWLTRVPHLIGLIHVLLRLLTYLVPSTPVSLINMRFQMQALAILSFFTTAAICFGDYCVRCVNPEHSKDSDWNDAVSCMKQVGIPKDDYCYCWKWFEYFANAGAVFEEMKGCCENFPNTAARICN